MPWTADRTSSRWPRRVVVVVILTLAVACNSGPTSPSATPNLRVHLTDNDTDALDAVNLFFTSVTVKRVGRGAPETLVLELDTNPQNLLVLRDQVIPLATGVVAPGAYEFLMINLDEGQSYVMEAGERRTLRIPSQEIKILGGFDVADDGTTTVVLDFDAEESLMKLGNGEWILTPVITREVEMSGS